MTQDTAEAGTGTAGTGTAGAGTEAGAGAGAGAGVGCAQPIVINAAKRSNKPKSKQIFLPILFLLSEFVNTLSKPFLLIFLLTSLLD